MAIASDRKLLNFRSTKRLIGMHNLFLISQRDVKVHSHEHHLSSARTKHSYLYRPRIQANAVKFGFSYLIFIKSELCRKLT